MDDGRPLRHCLFTHMERRFLKARRGRIDEYELGGGGGGEVVGEGESGDQGDGRGCYGHGDEGRPRRAIDGRWVGGRRGEEQGSGGRFV